jgi:hypothetical protein
MLRIRCVVCEKVKPEMEFHNRFTTNLGKDRRCKSCCAKRSKKWRDEHPGYWDMYHYNLSIDDKATMLEDQGGTCANTACDYGLDDDHKLVVDHDHETGKVRGLLCNWCNSAEGQLKGSPEVAEGLAKYMRKHNGKR